MLQPVANVEEGASGLVATSTEPWLSVEGLGIAGLAGRFVEIVYRLSFWDEPVRPIFRFRTGEDAYVDNIAAGPIAGAGIWIGRVPPATRRLDVSPTNRLGLFDFRIESIRPLPWLAVVACGLRRQPARARSALLARLIGWRPESDANLAWATGAIPMPSFEDWRAERALPLPARGRGRRLRRHGSNEGTLRRFLRHPAGGDNTPHPTSARKREKERARPQHPIETPRFDWGRTPAIRMVIGDGDPVLWRRTFESLQAQIFPNWTATVPHPGMVDDPRVGVAALGPAEGLTCWIGAGDVLVPEALAVAAEQAHRHPDGRLFYSDAIRIDADGRATPSFQPRLSPRRAASQPFGGTLIFARNLDAWVKDEQQRFWRAGEVAPTVLARLSSSQVRPLCRLLIETARSCSAPIPLAAPILRSAATTSVIIPTRDHPALLQRCIASIRAQAGPPPPQLVIVDNGSITEPARRLLAELSRASHTIVHSYPRPFDFSGMCNAGAALADGDILVFLNDDTKILSGDWLDRLATHAADPSTGAVGARLVYPDGRLQHVGIVAGMGGSSGHFGAFAPADAPGWGNRNMAPHEVSAVTGACLAVERSKFWAVGGFDETHLPVEFSDVDLCLKLNARGWQTLIDPAVTILHEESASRGGATFRRVGVYESQRTIFVERWRHVLRDDPYFHPGLSLYSLAPALA